MSKKAYLLYRMPLLVTSLIGLVWIIILYNAFSDRSAWVNACIPSNSDALWPYWRNNRNRFDELKANQCAIWQNTGFVDRYCFGSKINACVNTCSKDSQCLIERDVTNIDAKTTYVQQACLIKENDSKVAGDILKYIPVDDIGTGNTRLAPVSLFCQCRVNGECRNNEECIQGVCQCRNYAQCGDGRLCLWYGRNFNEIGNSYAEREYYPLGQCACDPNRGRDGCNGRGYCTQPENFRQCGTCINQRAYQVPSGAQLDGTAKCQCLNGFTGEYCGIDAAVNTMCSGNGTPLCLAVNAKDQSKRAVSLNTGADILSNLGAPLFMCDINTLKFPPETIPNRRGDYGCQCYPGWGPEIGAPGIAKCSQKIDCQTLAGNGKLVGFVAGNGKCKCLNDYYDSIRTADGKTATGAGSCLPECRLKRCSNHGTCVKDPATGDQFNSMCACDPGWQTSIETNKNNTASIGKAFEDKTFCDVPVDPVYSPNGAACGFWASEQIAQGSNDWCGLKPSYLPMSNVISPDPVIKLFVQSCGKSTNPLYLDQPCAGPTRGTCVSDGRYGSVCQCNNGFTGLSCDTLTCPIGVYINGGVCSGNGFCDNPTLSLGVAFNGNSGVCICKPGFGGTACEVRKLDCANSQTVRNYPLTHNITAIV